MGMNTAAVQRLYVAYFNRPADPVSLAVYEALLPTDREATQAELQAIADQYFSPSAEYQDMYAGKSNAQIVDQLYQNIFGREAEPAGLVAWAAELTSGTQTVASLALQLSYSAQGTDADVVANRIEAATAFTNALDTSGEITGYSGNDAAASARNWLATVGSDTASKDSAISGVDAAVTSAIAAAPVAGETYNLTTALDSKTLGDGDDQAFATDSATASADTFNVSDQVDGGAGTDTFSLTLNDSADDVSFTPSRITNFENVKLTNIDNAESLTVDVSLMGVSGVENAASTQAVAINNASAGTSLTVTGATAATTMTVLGAGLTGTADSASLSLTGASGAVTIESTTAQDIEALTVVAEGVNTSNVTVDDSGNNAAVTTVTVTGTGSWDMEGGGNLATALTTLDASGNSGGVTFTSSVAGTTLTGGSGNDDLTGAAGNDVISGGAGDDTLAMGSGGIDNVSGGAGNDVVTVTALTEDDTIAGGDGVDTLIIGSAIAYDDEATPTPIDAAANISGFEVLRATGTLTQDMAALDGIVALQSTSGILTATEAGAIGDFYALAASTGLDMTLATDGTADSLNVHVGNDTTQTASTGVTVDAIEIETALIASKGADGNTVTDFEADALTSLTVIGSKNLSVTLNDSAAVATIPLTTVDASGFTGDSLTISAVEADSGVTVTTGSEALTVTVGDGANDITGTGGNDSITTGSGADTIVSYGGDDTISAGDGANVITATDGENNITGGEGIDTITAGNGNNTITGGDGADVIVAGSGANTITNAAGNATITAGSGGNTVTNTAGDSTITLGGGDNTVNLTAGSSTVVTGDGADDINITAGNNSITAGGGNDTISLGSGNDTVDAGAGTDSVDFSVERGTWTGAISNAENVTASFTGSATIDSTGIAGYSSLTVTAADDTATTTVNNIGSSTITLSDDSVEGGGTGDLESVTIDTTDDATITVDLAANQNAAIAVESDLATLNVTDASSVTIKASGGGFGNLLAADMAEVDLDDDETTALTMTAADYTSLEADVEAGTESLATLTIDAEGAESDLTLDELADPTSLTSVSVTADGLNSTATVGKIGDAEAVSPVFAILDSVTVSASNGSTIDFNGGIGDNEEGDINTQGDLVSYSATADGTGSTVEAPEVMADGDKIGTVSYVASNGGTVDSDGGTATVEHGFGTLTMETSGAGSTVDVDYSMDEGAITASPEASITLHAGGAGSTLSPSGSDLGAVDLDVLSITIDSLATMETDSMTIEVDDDLGAMTFDVAANGVYDGDLDVDVAESMSSLTITLGDEADFAAEADVVNIDVAGGSDTVIGISTLTVNMADYDAAVTVDTTNANLIVVGGQEYFQVGDSEGEASDVKFSTGSVTLAGDSANTVNVSNTLADAEGDFSGFTVSTGAGADTITGGEGSDTITSTGGANVVVGADGNDNITTGSGGDSVTGGAGNDTIAVGAGADSVGGGAGNDTIDLTENVSAADVVEFSAVVGTSSDSAEVGAASGFIDSGQDTITTFTAGTDTIEITATNVESFAHGTDTDLGEGDATAEGDDSNSYATNVGLINMDGETADEFGDADDILINFNSPTTTMTEALFEAALKYDLTGTATADTMTGGGLADALSGGDGADTISGGAGADTITGGAGADNITLGTGSDRVVYADTGANNGVDTVTDFEAGATGDVLDFTNFITVAEADIDLALASNAEKAAATNHIFDTSVEGNIASKDYEGGDFGDIFAEGAVMDLASGSAMSFVVIVRGDDVTQILYVVSPDANALDATDVTAVGTLDNGDLNAESGFNKAGNFLDG